MAVSQTAVIQNVQNIKNIDDDNDDDDDNHNLEEETNMLCQWFCFVEPFLACL